MPEPTPRIPSALPWRAVACEDRPDREAVPVAFRKVVPVRERERRTYAENATGQIPSLDETCHASVGSREETSSEYYCGYAVKPRVLWGVTRSYSNSQMGTTDSSENHYS